MSLTPTTSNFVGSQTFGAVNSVNAITMNVNVLNSTTTQPAVLGVNKNQNMLSNVQQQPQQHQAQPQQLYHLIPITASNINTLQLGVHSASSHVPMPNATTLNKSKTTSVNSGNLSPTAATLKMCNNTISGQQQQQQQFTLEMQTNIAQIIGTALPIQNVVATNVPSIGIANKFGATTVKAVAVQGLAAAVQNSLAPAINTANATIIQLPATGNLQRVIAPAPPTAATLTTMPAAGTFSMINPNINSKLPTSQFVINSGGLKPTTATTTTIKLNASALSAALPSKTKIVEIKPMELEQKKRTLVATAPGAAQPLKQKMPTTTTTAAAHIAAQPNKQKMPATTTATLTAIAPIAQPKQTAIATTNAEKLQSQPHTGVRTVSAVSPQLPKAAAASNNSLNKKVAAQSTPASQPPPPQIDEIHLEKLLPETTITKEPITVTSAPSSAANNNKATTTTTTSHANKLTLSVLKEADSEQITNINTYVEDVDKSSEHMLVIDDSSDAESSENDNKPDVSDTTAEPMKSPPRICHISNSVVLTKADSRASNNTRQHMSSEPANVVLMKLPNAGSAKPENVAIPINEALTMAKEHLKSAGTGNSAQNVGEPRPILLQRSKSIPEAQKNLSPRAVKRSQSLNYGFLEKSKECGKQLRAIEHENIEKQQPDEELNKSNAEITFIELDDDSFDEDYTDESESSKATTPKKANTSNSASNQQTVQKQTQQITTTATTTLDKNDNIKASNAAVTTSEHQQQHKPQKQEQSVANSQKALQQQPQRASASKTSNDENDEQIIKSLLCNEQISAVTPSSSSSVSSLQEASPKLKANANCSKNSMLSNATSYTPQQQKQQTPLPAPPLPTPALSSSTTTHDRGYNLTKKGLNFVTSNPNANTRRQCNDNKIASALSMVSTFDMLNWKENNIGTARGTAMRFELNEFNLLQLHERNCPTRYRIHAAYERPIYERTFGLTPKADNSDPMLYMCRKCKTYGPAVDFLAPEFCSYACLRRTGIKRTSQTSNDVVDNCAAKRARKHLSVCSTLTPNSDAVVTSVGASNTAKSNSNAFAATTAALPKFRWSNYLAAMRTAYAAPIDLFLNPFPTGPNPFNVGMKLEAIDPENCSLFCVCTVAEIKGYRMRLNFDGYDSIYDFWVNADSMDIFPPGWCEKTKRLLQPPRNFVNVNGNAARQFNWYDYLKRTNGVPADKKLFTHLNGSSLTNRNPFQIGMFLEADDLNDTGKLCVASVADVLDERIRVHFDGWDDCYDYWVDISSPYIHPCGWHAGRQQLLVPPEYGNTSFSWQDYILEANSGPAAPEDFFVPRDSIDYRPGMKLEVVDPRNPSLIRPASVVHRTRHRVKIIFDCWPMDYTFVLEDDSPDLHPIGWCDATGHELEPPPGYQQFKKIMPCNTPGCRGIGNMNRNNGRSHATREACPYALENWRTKCEKTPRVEGKQIVRAYTPPTQEKQAEQKKQLTPESSISEVKPQIPKTRGRPRKVDRQPAAAVTPRQVEQHQRLIGAVDIKTERGETAVSVPVTTTPQIKIEAVVSNGISAHKLAAAQTLEPHIATVKRFLCDYGPRLQQNYALWRENLAGFDIAAIVQQNPLHWTTGQACEFFKDVLSSCDATLNLGCDVATAFLKHEIDGAALLMLQQQDLLDILQLKLGPALKICAIILQLRILVATKYESASGSSSNSSGSGGNFEESNKHNSFESETECSVK